MSNTFTDVTAFKDNGRWKLNINGTMAKVNSDTFTKTSMQSYYGITFLGIDTEQDETDYSGFYPQYYNPTLKDVHVKVKFLVESSSRGSAIQNINTLTRHFFYRNTEITMSEFTFCGVVEDIETEMITGDAYKVNILMKGRKLSAWKKMTVSTAGTLGVSNNGACPVLVDMGFTAVNNSQQSFILDTKLYTFNGLTAGKKYWLDSQEGALWNLTDNRIESECFTSNYLPVIPAGSSTLDITGATNISNVSLYFREKYV